MCSEEGKPLSVTLEPLQCFLSSFPTEPHFPFNTCIEMLNVTPQWLLCVHFPALRSGALVMAGSLRCWLQPSRLLCPWDSPGKHAGGGCCALLQGIFLTQEAKPYLWCLLHGRQVLYPLSHLGSPVHFPCCTVNSWKVVSAPGTSKVLVNCIKKEWINFIRFEAKYRNDDVNPWSLNCFILALQSLSNIDMF